MEKREEGGSVVRGEMKQDGEENVLSYNPSCMPDLLSGQILVLYVQECLDKLGLVLLTSATQVW